MSSSNRMRRFGALTLLFGLTAACRSVEIIDGDSTGGSTSATGTGGAGGEMGTCNEPPPPSPTQPSDPGCYLNDMGSGWVEIPCSCDLWLRNTGHAPITASIQLVVTPAEPPPTLTGSFDVEVAFEDADASWYTTWAAEPGNGTEFAVVHDAGDTIVRMASSTLTLPWVPVGACTTRKGTAHVLGTTAGQLAIHAVVDDGSGLTFVDAPCSAPHPATP